MRIFHPLSYDILSMIICKLNNTILLNGYVLLIMSYRY